MDASATVQAAASLNRAAASARRLEGSASRARQTSVALLAVLLAMLTAATLIACFYAMVIPQQLDEGEPLVYGLAGRILQQQPLYQPIDRQPFVQVHYTPLYYLAVAELRRRVGPGFAPGRALSLAVGVGAAGSVGYLTASRTRSWPSGGFAILLFLGLGFPGGPTPFLALERVDALGVCLAMAAVAVLSYRTSWPHVIVAGVLAGLALLTKQSLFAAGLAGMVWLATLDRRKASAFAVTAAVTVLVPAVVLQVTSGGAFWDNVGPANPSPVALPLGAVLFKELLAVQGVLTLLALVYVIGTRAWRFPSTRLLLVYWIAAAIPIAGIVKVGANHNYWTEFAAANAVLAALCIWTSMRRAWRIRHAVVSMLPILLLAADLGLLTPARVIADRADDLVPLGWTLALGQLNSLRSEASEFNRLVHDVRGEKGLVLAESMDIAVLGDHPPAFEPFAFSMLESEGRWNPQPLVGDICSGGTTLLILSYPIELDVYPGGLYEFPMWPRSVMTALRESMTLEGPRAVHWLYRPRPTPDAASVAQCNADAAAARAQ